MNDYRNNDWTRPSPVGRDTGRGPSTPTRRPAPPRDPAPVAPAEPPPPSPMAQPLSRPRVSRHSSSRHQSSSSRRKIARLKLVIALLLAAAVVAAVVGIFGFSKLTGFRTEAMNLTTKLRQSEGELAKAREKLTEMNNDLRIMLANRIPGVSEIGFNRQIEVNDQYLKNVTFVRSGIGAEQTIEYSAVLENTRSGPILPQVTLVLFDESGLQTGAVSLDKKHAVSPVSIPELQPGETRTYSARIPMQRQAPSKYFVVEVR